MLAYYSCIISVLWVSLTACLGQSLENKLTDELRGITPDCLKALFSCGRPVVLPYATASDVDEALEIARNIQLEQHCRRFRKSFVCFRGLIGKGQCSDIDRVATLIWKRVGEPLVDEALTYICTNEFKKFHIHYRCLLTKEVYTNIQQSCSTVRSESEANDCLGRVIRDQCGSTASEITLGLVQMITERSKALEGVIKGLQVGDDRYNDDDQQRQDTIPGNVYARQLATLKELLKRK